MFPWPTHPKAHLKGSFLLGSSSKIDTLYLFAVLGRSAKRTPSSKMPKLPKKIHRTLPRMEIQNGRRWPLFVRDLPSTDSFFGGLTSVSMPPPLPTGNRAVMHSESPILLGPSHHWEFKTFTFHSDDQSCMHKVLRVCSPDPGYVHSILQGGETRTPQKNQLSQAA